MGRAPSHLSNYTPPGGRRPPPEVVEGLRDVDPTAELVYVGKGRWMLGTVKHDRERYKRAVRAIGAYLTVLNFAAPGGRSHVEGAGSDLELTPENRRQLMYRLWKKRLQLQGFRIVCVFRQEPDSAVVDAFKAMDWLYKNRFDEVEAEEREKAEGDSPALKEKKAQVLEYFRAEHKDIHSRVFRKKLNVPKDVDGFSKPADSPPAVAGGAP